TAGTSHGFALWSDGTVSGWGSQGNFSYPQPHPTRGNLLASPGDRFAGVSAGFWHTLVLRADGMVEGHDLLAFSGSPADIPTLPSGTTYTKVQAGFYLSAFLRSDGELLVWGDNTYGQSNVPALPLGVTYTDVDVGDWHVVALR